MRSHTSVHSLTREPMAIVVAVAHRAGADAAAQLLARVTRPTAPVIVCAEAEARDQLRTALPHTVATPADGHLLNVEPIWVTPADSIATVQAGRWSLASRPAAAFDDRIGRLCSSLRALYRSRVLVVSTTPGLDTNPLVRLLLQRGATLIEPGDPTDAVVHHLHPIDDTIEEAVA